MKIFSDELKNKVKEGMEKFKTKATDVAGKASETIDAVGGEFKKAANEVVEETKKTIDPDYRKEAERRTYKKAQERKAAKEARQKEIDQIKAEIESYRNTPGVVEIYSQRSRYNETRPLGPNECIVTAKVTVIGVVKELSNGKFRLYVSFSRRNPEDVYDKRLGYLTALRRAMDPKKEFEIEGHMFETIKVGDFDTPFLKEIFMPIANTLIDAFEYEDIRLKKALANSILAQEVADDFDGYEDDAPAECEAEDVPDECPAEDWNN